MLATKATKATKVTKATKLMTNQRKCAFCDALALFSLVFVIQ
jgi:hypothetical protein